MQSETPKYGYLRALLHLLFSWTILQLASFCKTSQELPLTPFQDSGRISVPYVLIYYMPVTCNAELRMIYASAKELMRNTAEVGKVLEIDSQEDLEEIPEKLKGN